MIYDDFIQVIDPEGRVVNDTAIGSVSEDLILKMYRLMVFTRHWNVKCLSLQRQGRLGTLASVRGQEGANIGMGLALKPGDWLIPSFREYGAQFVAGVKPMHLMSYWGGDDRGMKPPADRRVLPICITVGSHLLHAAGIAFGAKIRGEKVAVLSSSGDGSTSQGDFHEALNFAGVYNLPVVFVIQNNHWAISVPVEKQTASKTLAEKACAYAISGARVDGNDVVAVYLTVKNRLDLARDEYLPALVELVTYRMDDHTTADDASRYRTQDMVTPWKARDPIDRIRKYLTSTGGWDEDKEAGLTEEITAEVEKIVSDFEAIPHPRPEEMFHYMYADTPWHLLEQMEEVRRIYGEVTR